MSSVLDPAGRLWTPSYAGTYDFVETDKKEGIRFLDTVPNGNHGKYQHVPMTRCVEIYRCESQADGYPECSSVHLEFYRGQLMDYMYKQIHIELFQSMDLQSYTELKKKYASMQSPQPISEEVEELDEKFKISDLFTGDSEARRQLRAAKAGQGGTSGQGGSDTGYDPKTGTSKCHTKARNRE